jgi:hypothetical protein
MTFPAVALLAVLAVQTGPADPPSLAYQPARRFVTAAVQAPASTGRMVAFGLAGGAVGVLAGGLLGGVIGGGSFFGGRDCPNEEWVCAIRGAFIGAVIGESLLLPLGVHLADHRQGSWPLAALASSAIGGLGAVLAYENQDSAVWIVSLTPIAQLASSIAIQGSTR